MAPLHMPSIFYRPFIRAPPTASSPLTGSPQQQRDGLNGHGSPTAVGLCSCRQPAKMATSTALPQPLFLQRSSPFALCQGFCRLLLITDLVSVAVRRVASSTSALLLLVSSVPVWAPLPLHDVGCRVTFSVLPAAHFSTTAFYTPHHPTTVDGFDVMRMISAYFLRICLYCTFPRSLYADALAGASACRVLDDVGCGAFIPILPAVEGGALDGGGGGRGGACSTPFAERRLRTCSPTYTKVGHAFASISRDILQRRRQYTFLHGAAICLQTVGSFRHPNNWLALP